jgi:DNA polymerase-3 subunit chi
MSAPRVDFYVLASSDGPARLRFACRLVEKAWLKQHRVRVQLDPGGELAAFDELLWTYSDGSFVPHQRLGDDAATSPPAPAPVVLADLADADPADGDLIVNLSAALPHGFERFQRIAEVIDADTVRRQRGRERFRQYRERGIQPDTHDMKEGA